MGSQPRPVGAALERLGSGAPRTRLAELVMVWERTVGPTIAAQADPVAERDGRVRVACRSSVWAQELALLAPELCRRLTPHLAEPWLRELRFGVGPGWE